MPLKKDDIGLADPIEIFPVLVKKPVPLTVRGEEPIPFKYIFILANHD